MPDIKDHQRVNDIFLGPLERPALRWLSAHMPSWVTPDILTGIGIFGSLLTASSYALTRIHPGFLWLASLGFVINWFGDSLDGTVARYRNIQRPRYGFFLDHTVDAFNEVIIFLGLGISPYVTFELAALALIGYLLVSIYVYVSTAVTGVFQLSYGKLGPTEIRALAILANALIFFIGNPQLKISTLSATVYDWLVGLVTVILYMIFFISTYKTARNLDKEDRVARSSN